MCQVGGPRCANHVKKEIAKLEAVTHKNQLDDNKLTQSRLIKARLDYAGTPTGQNELQSKIDEEEKKTGTPANKLRSYKNMAHQHYRTQQIVGKVTRSNDLSSLPVEERLAASYNTDSPELVDRLAKNDPSENVRYSAISSPYVTQETLKEISHDEEPLIRAGVAARIEEEKTQYRFAQEKSLPVRKSLASNRNLSKDASYILAHDKEPMVRESLAHNPNSNSYLLHTLSLDEDKHVRRAIASHKNADPSTLDSLAKDKDAEVRLNTASNLRTYDTTIKDLTQDSDERVAKAAQEEINRRKLFTA